MQTSFSISLPRFFFHLVAGTFLLLIIGLGVSLETPFSFSIAHAGSGTASFSLQPVYYDPSNPVTKSYFVFSSKPGQVVKSSIRVTNTGTAMGTASLYPVDATTGQTSGAVYLNQNDPRSDVGAWITLSTPQVTLKPGQSTIVAFQTHVPSTVRAGQHLGGIVAENLTQNGGSQTQGNSPFHINVKSLRIIAVQVNLPGVLIEQLAATGVQAGGSNGYQQLFIGLSNTGNVMLKPAGTLQIANAQGRVVKKLALNLDTFLPQTSINYPVGVTGQALGAANYQATLTLNYGHGQVLHYNTSFMITQQQLAQTFSAIKTQAPAGFLSGDSAGVSPFVLIGAGGGIILLFGVIALLGWKLMTNRKATQPAHIPPSQSRSTSQFKRPGPF